MSGASLYCPDEVISDQGTHPLPRQLIDPGIIWVVMDIVHEKEGDRPTIVAVTEGCLQLARGASIFYQSVLDELPSPVEAKLGIRQPS